MEKGIPRNPLINAGALVMADVLLSDVRSGKGRSLFLCGNFVAPTRFQYNESMAASEWGVRDTPNAAITNMLK